RTARADPSIRNQYGVGVELSQGVQEAHPRGRSVVDPGAGRGEGAPPTASAQLLIRGSNNEQRVCDVARGPPPGRSVIKFAAGPHALAAIFSTRMNLRAKCAASFLAYCAQSD